MKIAISCESTCDLTKELIKEFDISVIPYEVVLGDECFKDGEIENQKIFDFVTKTGVLPKTNALNFVEYTEYFEGLLKEYDAVVHVCLSSGASSSYNNANNAAKELKNVYVVDSKSLSTGIGMLVLYGRKLANEGVSAEQIAQKLTERREKVQASFIVERLDYLFKGGRCNSLQRFGANVFKLRPRIVLKDGLMSSDKNYRGSMGSVMAKYVDDVINDFPNPDRSMFFITYSSATPEMIDSVKNTLANYGITEYYETNAGATVTSHCGENTMGILYFNDGESVF